MFPELYVPFGEGTILVRSYALFAALGAIMGAIVAYPALRRRGLSATQTSWFICAMMIGFLVGARLLNVLVNGAAYPDVQAVFRLRLSGLSFYGGLLGALTVAVVWVRLNKMEIWCLLDAFVLPATVAFVLARTGCFLNGCCSGIPTDSALGVVFPAGESEAPVSGFLLSILGQKKQIVARHPTQLYEAGLAMVGLIPVYWHRFRWYPPAGTTFLSYGIWFSVMRLSILPLRSLPYDPLVKRMVYPVFYVVLIVLGIYLVRQRYLSEQENLRKNTSD